MINKTPTLGGKVKSVKPASMFIISTSVIDTRDVGYVSQSSDSNGWINCRTYYGYMVLEIDYMIG